MTDVAPDGDRIRRRVVVFGVVHGVGFRASCARRALASGVAGSVRNRMDGAVEAVFEGEPGAVDALVAWCHDGPPMARVSGVDVQEEEPLGEIGFGVL